MGATVWKQGRGWDVPALLIADDAVLLGENEWEL